MLDIDISRDQLDFLFGVIKKINSADELDNLLEDITIASSRVCTCETSALLLIDHKTGELYYRSAAKEQMKPLAEKRIPLDQGIVGLAAREGNPVIVNDAGNDTRVVFYADSMSRDNTRSILCVPLKIKEKIIGVLECINSTKDSGFTEDDSKLLTVFGDFAAIAINNRELFKTTVCRLNQITTIYKISQAASRAGNIKNLCSTTIDIISEAMNAGRVSIILKDEITGKYVFLAGKNIDSKVLKAGKITLRDNVLSFVHNLGDGVFTRNIETDERFGVNKKLRYKSKSFVCAPIINKNIISGFISVTERADNGVFHYDDLVCLKTVCQEFIDGYNHIRMNRELAEKSRLDTEIEIIARLQRDILPDHFPAFRGVAIAAASIPCRKVGGDFYDIIPADSQSFTALIADVSGKGLPAAVFMYNCRALLRVLVSSGGSLGEIFSGANRYICRDSLSGMFATSFMAYINLKKKKINFSNAGHFDQYLFKARQKKIVPLNAGGKPLGVDENERYQQKSQAFSSGDLLILFTDGIIEAVNKKHEQFGETRLKKIISSGYRLAPSALKNKIISEVKRFTGGNEISDDLAVLIIKF
ncbi:MAG TPA: hypothetical protein DC049_12990 [Spirochaetia bacterium]|nr:hypothetical protein [Spirochaetia bacterium]